MDDPLVQFPIERWSEIQEAFKKDYPRGISGDAALQTQRIWEERGFGYGFTVYCPYGDPNLGMVALDSRDLLFIQCPTDDTSKLEESLKKTKLIDWNKPILKTPVSPYHIRDVSRRLAEHAGKRFTVVDTHRFVLDDDKPLYDVSLPSELTFKLLTTEYAELMDSKWPHRHPGSVWIFDLMIKAKSSYGLFLNDKLVSWMNICEHGCFVNLYTLEEYRGKGYAQLVTKLICNNLKKEGRHIFGFVVLDNVASYKLFEKLGFTNTGIVGWCFIEDKEKPSLFS